jgi:NIMA (never in mitosis gene a)-related kinase
MENYEVIEKLTKGNLYIQFLGAFGVVSKIKRKSDGKILVWKELNYGRMGEKEKQQVVGEVNILRELKH